MKKVIISLVTIAILALVGSAIFVISVANKAENTPKQANNIIYTSTDLVERTNQLRRESGLKPLISDSLLEQTAKAKLDDMIQLNYFSHWNPVNGKSGTDVAYEMGIKCIYSSENLAKDAPGNPIDGLMTSESHKKAILDPRYETVGIAYKNGITVQHFCDVK